MKQLVDRGPAGVLTDLGSTRRLIEHPGERARHHTLGVGPGRRRRFGGARLALPLLGPEIGGLQHEIERNPLRLGCAALRHWRRLRLGLGLRLRRDGDRYAHGLHRDPLRLCRGWHVLVAVADEIAEQILRGQRTLVRLEASAAAQRLEHVSLAVRLRRPARGLERRLYPRQEILAGERLRDDVLGAEVGRVGLRVRARVAAHEHEKRRVAQARPSSHLSDRVLDLDLGENRGDQDDARLDAGTSPNGSIDILGRDDLTGERCERLGDARNGARLIVDEKNRLGHNLRASRAKLAGIVWWPLSQVKRRQ